MVRKPLPEEALITLRQRFEQLSITRVERKQLVQETATLYGVSTATTYRALRTWARVRPLRRTDAGLPRILPAAELERYCELIAALQPSPRHPGSWALLILLAKSPEVMLRQPRPSAARTG